ncbi:2-keto-4-pentenoate hydratase [Sinisalibacter aestuarii]|uniref:2-keto-4-pentenoate hydratase n=1 Tax=Sinisalibacter aestuarii TaxID=2949426 RepID=A0ABQ5LVG3_9RHOB|nr:2-keto-4-pentenoate hydratase [Sinisalibacter aestuarii]
MRESHGLARLEDAQAVQDGVTARGLAAGRRLVGRKIGLTSAAVQAQMGVDQPDYGVLWADYAFSSGDEVAISRFMQPRAEGEIAFVMERGIEDPAASMTDLIGAIAYALPAIEIVDSAIADWNIGLVDTIADNASGGGFALGSSPRALAGLDLRLAGMMMTRNGRTVSTGLGAACMGHPLNATLWLVRKMASLGRPVAAGDVILSGALGPVVPVSGGDVFSLEIMGFEPLQIAFDTGDQAQ